MKRRRVELSVFELRQRLTARAAVSVVDVVCVAASRNPVVLTALSGAVAEQEAKERQEAMARGPLHCVRCHQEYSLANTGPRSCVMPHIGHWDRFRPMGWDAFGYTCCRRERDGNCFYGSHTTDVKVAWKYLKNGDYDVKYPECEKCKPTHRWGSF